MFLKRFWSRSLSASKNNHGSYILAHVNVHCPDDTYAKLQIYISELILDRYIPVTYL